MNFDEAIRAHAAWKMKLTAYLKNPDNSLKADEIQRDNRCDLGKWIYGDGGKYGTLPEFQSLKTEHRAFHEAAAQIVKKASSGTSTSEQTALGANSEFAKRSASVVSMLMKMKIKMGA